MTSPALAAALGMGTSSPPGRTSSSRTPGSIIPPTPPPMQYTNIDPTRHVDPNIGYVPHLPTLQPGAPTSPATLAELIARLSQFGQRLTASRGTGLLFARRWRSLAEAATSPAAQP